ncbi:MAG: SurA N-terminal domain-containing protein [Gammaproteobacteria bacterium]
MLQTIREHTQGWIAGTIVSIIILTFALWGIHSYFNGGGTNSVVAEVNNIDITREQLTIAYERMRRQVQAQYGSNLPASLGNEAAMKKRALQALIDVEVLKQGSIDQGFQVSNSQIDTYLQSMPEFQVDGRFSIDRFQEALSATTINISEFLDMIRTSLLIDQPKLGIIFSSFSLPDETRYTMALVNQERDIDYVQLPLSYFLAQPMQIPTDTVKAYYDEHEKDFMTPEQVSLEYVELSLKDLSSKINPTDTMLKNFYAENANNYTQPTEWKLASIQFPLSEKATVADNMQAKDKANAALEALKKGDDFVKVAAGLPDTLSPLGFIPLNKVPADLQKAVMQLVKPGQLSDVIQTANGLVIIKAIEIHEPEIQPFEAVKDKVKETYVRQHAEEKFAELRDQLADAAYEHPDSLTSAAKVINAPIKTSVSFTRQKGGNDLSRSKKIRDAAFSHDVIELQNNSDVIQFDPETLVVIRLKNHVASALLPMNNVAKQIEDKLKIKEAETRAAQYAADVQSKLQAGASPQVVMANTKFIWTKVGFTGRYAKNVDTAILDEAFSLPNPSTVPNKISYGVTRLSNGYAVVALKGIKDGAVDEKQSAVFAEQVQNSQGLLEYELYKLSQTKAASITIEN